jgi:hypothetical protein
MGYKHQLNEYNLVNEIKYYITYDKQNTDGTYGLVVIPLLGQDIIESQIVWDVTKQYAQGSVILQDKKNMLATLIVHNSMKLRIEAKDKWDITFNHSFNISSITTEYNTTSKSTIRIDFIDMYYNFFTNLHLSKGYNKVTMDEVLTDILNSPLCPFENDKVLKFSETKTRHENLVIPNHRPFANFLANRELIDGFSYIYARDRSYILNPEDLVNPNKVVDGLQFPDPYKIIFKELQSVHKHLPYQIKSIKRLYADLFAVNSVLPVSNDLVFDYTKKVIKEGDTSTIKTVGDYQKNIADGNKTFVNSVLAPVGYKGREVLSEAQNNRFYSFKLLENSMYEIITDGTFMLDIMQVVGLNINMMMKDVEMKNYSTNGQYYIIKIVDKFQGQNFSQIVTIGRSGYMNGAK